MWTKECVGELLELSIATVAEVNSKKRRRSLLDGVAEALLRQCNLIEKIHELELEMAVTVATASFAPNGSCCFDVYGTLRCYFV